MTYGKPNISGQNGIQYPRIALTKLQR